MKPLEDVLLELAEKKGFRMVFISASHLEEAKQIIDELIANEEVDKEFAEENLSYFEYGCEKDLKEVKSVILIAFPCKKSKLVLHGDGAAIEVIVPPTYIGLRSHRLGTLAELKEILKMYGYHATKALIPEKTMAVRSGLARYGRCNITFIPEFGSFYALLSYLTDAPLQESRWGDALAVEQCQDCFKCLNACPTKAISRDRFLIHAEKCLALYTESDKEFPDWIDPKWQNSLLGCIACQSVCPINKPFLDAFEMTVDFSTEDVRAILEEPEVEKLPGETSKKVHQLGFEPFYSIFSQNVKRIMKKVQMNNTCV
jgi:epoxyqueuosine reductase